MIHVVLKEQRKTELKSAILIMFKGQCSSLHPNGLISYLHGTSCIHNYPCALETTKRIIGNFGDGASPVLYSFVPTFACVN